MLQIGVLVISPNHIDKQCGSRGAVSSGSIFFAKESVSALNVERVKRHYIFTRNEFNNPNGPENLLCQYYIKA